MKDIISKAQLLTTKEILVVDYAITPNVTGTIKLTNNVLLLTPDTLKKLKSVLKFFENYVTNYYILK
jgi:hypothetical protein